MMSTRSGKRIHRSFHDNTLQLATELLVKSEKKTRGRRLKENCDDNAGNLIKSGKRNNYVSYPTDSEVNEESDANSGKEDTKKPNTRRTVLKEHNEVESSTKTLKPEVKKAMRQSRRTRKDAESPENPLQETFDENEVQSDNIDNHDTKKKKKKRNRKTNVEVTEPVPVPKKKSKKKKNKRSNSIEFKFVVEEKMILNKSSASVDSFHSAAGSPVHESLDDIGTLMEVTENPDASFKSPKKFDHGQKRKSSLKNSTFDKIENNSPNTSTKKNSTFDVSSEPQLLNTTFEKDYNRKSTRLSNAVQNVSKTKSLDITFEKDDKLNSTFDKDEKQTSNIDKDQKLNGTFEREEKLNSTFDKNDKLNSAKSSLVSSDSTINITDDKSNNSRISITSDDSKTENIINTTPLLIESSLDESQIKSDTPKQTTPVTPLKREGTFTKDAPEVFNSSNPETPTKRMTMPSPGSTPFHGSKNSQRKVLNVTRSLEKPTRKSSIIESTRMTKVMFCSPVDNPAANTERKRKVIKSSMKGSNKSFVFDETASSVTKSSRKRSFTHDSAEDARVKRKRLADDLQQSVDRLSRPRTSSASAKLTEAPTPSKKPTVTPQKTQKADAKLSRTKLPNFAALHQRRFEKMESLDECQERKAKRAKQLLTPNGAINIIEKSSPKAMEQLKHVKEAKKSNTKMGTPTKPKLPAFNAKNNSKAGFTRFGFKMNLDVNPFSIPKTAEKPKEIKPNGVVNGLKRQPTLPSLAGITVVRKEAAKQAIMREKSFSERRDVKRKETRTTIKGVRTNRRFELQMQMRNIN